MEIGIDNYIENEIRRQQAKQELYVALDIGEKLLISGAEVSRVEDTIGRICRSFGAQRVDVFTITSSIIVTMYSDTYGPITQTRRISSQGTNLQKLNLLNQLSREICSQQITMEEIPKKLKEIDAIKEEGAWMHCLIFAFISAIFAVFFGGTLGDGLAAAIVGVLLGVLDLFWRRTSTNKFLTSLTSSFLGGLIAILLVRIGLGDSVNKINIGNIMLLIPGFALTNSMRDIFSGDTIAGTLRFLESVLLAMTLAVGFVLASHVGLGGTVHSFSGGSGVVLMVYVIQTVTALLGSLGFNMLFHIEKDKLIKAGIGGALAWGVYLLAGLWIHSDPVQYLLATFALTFYAEYFAVREKTPVTVFLVSGAIPLIPGGSLYQTMTYAVEGDWMKFLNSGANTLLLALAIAVGMLIGMNVSRGMRYVVRHFS